MFQDNNTPSSSRHHALLSVVMLGALIFVTLIAWWMVPQPASSEIRENGAEIVDEIRNRRLSDFWGERLEVQWFLTYAEGMDEPIGWSASLRNRRENGQFEGLKLNWPLISTPNPVHWEQWTLNPQATNGSYRAGTIVVHRGVAAPTDLRLSFKDGTLSARYSRKGTASITVPSNYLPEGTMELAMYLAARKDTTAGFRMVFNEVPPENNLIKLGTLIAEDPEPHEDGVSVRLRQLKPRNSKQRIYFDQAGKVKRIEFPSRTVVAVSRQEILKRDSSAENVLIEFAREMGIELSGTESDEEGSSPDGRQIQTDDGQEKDDSPSSDNWMVHDEENPDYFLTGSAFLRRSSSAR